MTDFLLILLLAVILGGAAFYIVRAKKRGQKCVGCPHSGSCGKNCGCNCNH